MDTFLLDEQPGLLFIFASPRLGVLECIEGLVGVPNEWQTHLCILLCRHLFGLCSMHGTVVLLWDLIDREVANINVGRKFRLKRGPDLPKLLPNHAAEEWMLLDG